MNLSHLSVRGQLTLAFGGLIALVLLIAGLAIQALGASNAEFETYVNGVNRRAKLAEEVHKAVAGRAIAARYVEEGARVVICDLLIEEARQSLPGENWLRKSVCADLSKLDVILSLQLRRVFVMPDQDAPQDRGARPRLPWR